MSKELGKTERPQIAASPSARPGAGKTACPELRLTRPLIPRPATQPVCKES